MILFAGFSRPPHGREQWVAKQQMELWQHFKIEFGKSTGKSLVDLANGART